MLKLISKTNPDLYVKRTLSRYFLYQVFSPMAVVLPLVEHSNETEIYFGPKHRYWVFLYLLTADFHPGQNELQSVFAPG